MSMRLCLGSGRTCLTQPIGTPAEESPVGIQPAAVVFPGADRGKRLCAWRGGLSVISATPALHTVVLVYAAAVKAPGADGRKHSTWWATLVAVSVHLVVLATLFLVASGAPTVQAPVAANGAAVEVAAAHLGKGTGRWVGLPMSIGPPAVHCAIPIDGTAVRAPCADL